MASTPYFGEHLLSTPAFRVPTYGLPRQEKTKLGYERARALIQEYKLTMDDVLSLSPKFWDLHQHPLMAFDGSAITIATIQVNLTAGTIARQAVQRPELVPLVEDLLNFRKHGQFLMTEVGHGLDIANLETTATRLPTGEFILNSPTPSSAKFMPPTVPAGLPMVAIVYAKLIVDGEDRGTRPFLVPLNDGTQMCAGITSTLLPERFGPNPVNHSITTFHNVRLPAGALFGTLERPASPRMALTQSMWRVVCGTIAIGSLVLPIMKAYATIGALYSIRRHVGPPNARVPILSFRTQQLPLLTLVAQTHVMQAFVKWATEQFSDTTLDYRVRHAIAGILKATIVGHANAGGIAMSDRCGVQGLFAHNQLTVMHNETRGIAIAEGDVLALSIKLVTEMLQGRYKVPAPVHPQSLLAQHEAGLFNECRGVLAAAKHHRSDAVSKQVLPQCQPILEAIGHRMAYDAARLAGLDKAIIDLYEVSAAKLDGAWYAEHAGVTRTMLNTRESDALDALLPKLGSLVSSLGMEPWVTAPIVSDDRWDAFVGSCAVYGGDAPSSSVYDFPGSYSGVSAGAVALGWEALPVLLSYVLAPA